MQALGEFARQAAPLATGIRVAAGCAGSAAVAAALRRTTHEAIEAQQTAVRVLYNYDHAAAYAVGEYQIETLGSPQAHHPSLGVWADRRSMEAH